MKRAIMLTRVKVLVTLIKLLEYSSPSWRTLLLSEAALIAYSRGRVCKYRLVFKDYNCSYRILHQKLLAAKGTAIASYGADSCNSSSFSSGSRRKRRLERLVDAAVESRLGDIGADGMRGGDYVRILLATLKYPHRIVHLTLALDTSCASLLKRELTRQG